MSRDQEKFESFLLPDVSAVDTTKIKKFSKSAPEWRTVAQGLNLQGMCKNKQCAAGATKSMVWTNLKFETFHMSQTVHKCQCPICGVYTRGNKRIGLFKCTLNGRGMKATVKATETQPASQGARNSQDTDDQDNDEKDKEVEIQFPTIKVDAKDGFLKMDGVNGKFVKWRYMTLQIGKLAGN